MMNHKTTPSEILTRRERAILLHLVEDKSNQEIAALESLALNSVKWYIQQVYAKLGVNRRGEVERRARELGLIQVSPAPAPISGGNKNNLPLHLTSFVGREDEITELRLLLRKPETRLLTLTGAGGTGKTRLALQAAADLQDAFFDGIWLAELAPLSDPLLIPQTLIAALGQADPPGKAPIDFLTDFLRPRQILLIMDNCEHIVEACAELASVLLHNAPRLTILATSREILGVAGELSYRVPPLAMPAPNRLLSLDELVRFDALRLFVERARLVSPGFALTEDNAAEVVQIASRLDGIPLALELAAGRLHLLSVKQLASRLNDTFGLLTSGRRTALPRHQTLQALIDWSYNLLSDAERGLLRSLSVFAGGWTLEAAEEICSEGNNVLDLLGQLADKSLILVVPAQDGEMRYRMLETIRQFLLSKLREDGGETEMRDRHSVYFMAFLCQHYPGGHFGLKLAEAIEIKDEKDNLQAAVDWVVQKKRYDILVGCVDGLFHVFSLLHLTRKGEEVFQSIASNMGGAPDPRILARLGALHFMLGNYAAASEKLEKSLELARASADWSEIAFSLKYLGDLERWLGKNKMARDRYLECLSFYQRMEHLEGTAQALFELGQTDEHMGKYEKAVGYYRQSLAINQTIASPEQIAICLDKMGALSFYRGDYAHSQAYYAESLSIFRDLSNKFGQCLALGGLGWNAWVKGGPHLLEAEQFMQDSLSLCREISNQMQMVDRIGLLCLVKNSLGDYETSRQLCQEALLLYQSYPLMAFAALVLAMLGEAETGLGDYKSARKHLSEALQIAIDHQAQPTVALILFCSAVLLMKECETGELPPALKQDQIDAAYLIAAFVRDDLLAWQIYRDKAAALVETLLLESRETNRELPTRTKELPEVLKNFETHFS